MKEKRGCGKMGIAVSILASFLMALPAWGAPVVTDDVKGDSVRSPRAPLADLDGDGISEGLAEKLDRLRPDELVKVIVTFNGPGNSESVQKMVGPFQVRRNFDIIPGFVASMRAAQARALAGLPGVFRVEEDFPVHVVMDAARDDFGIEAAQQFYEDIVLTGEGTGICIVDTGIDPGHEQLDAAGKIVAFSDFVNGRTEAYDDQGHGTHVAAISAGDGEGGANAFQFRGVAPGASLFGAKVLDSQGSGTATAIIDGIEWCASRTEVDIISMSLGTSSGSDGQDSLSLASDAAADAGKIVVVAAGNSGDGQSTVGSPGAAEKAITVGAVAEWSAPFNAANHSDGIFLAWFSSRGPISPDTPQERIKPDIVAPGVTITSAKFNTTNEYATYSGTSMATPFVSGTIALALEERRKKSRGPVDPLSIKNHLMATAQDRGIEGLDNDWGAGLLDGYGFITSAGSMIFPGYEKADAKVIGSGGLWQYPIDVEDTDIPIGITITIKGDSQCLLWLMPGVCWIMEGPPDLDARLIAPDGLIVDESTCPGDLDFSGECGSVGRQELIHWMPTTAGRYTLEVYPYEGALGTGEEAGFLVDFSYNDGTVSDPPPADTTAPSVSFIHPTEGMEVSGEVVIQVQSQDETTSPEALAVEVSIDGGSRIATQYNSSTGYFETSWDTTGYVDGVHTLTAMSTDGSGNFNERTVSVTVNNGTSTVEDSVHVEAMEGSSTSVKSEWIGTVTVTIYDQDENPQSGATVTGNWSIGGADVCDEPTDVNGTCTFTGERISKKEKNVTFSVTDVSAEKTYRSENNKISEITINKP